MICTLDSRSQINMELVLDLFTTGLAEPLVSEAASWTGKRKDMCYGIDELFTVSVLGC
jgi:hypothetical protein